MPLPAFLKKDGNAVLFNGTGEMQVFIPEKMYSLKLAFSAGEFQNIFGLVPYCLVDTKTNKRGEMKIMHEPTRFLTKPGSIDKLKGVKLTKNTPEQDYRVLHYVKGDAIIVDTRVPQEIENVEDFINLVLITGNLLNVVPYDKIWKYFMKNIEVNGYNYNVSAQLFGIMLSENCRDINNQDKPFRLGSYKDMTAYKLLGVRELSRIISPYSEFTSDNFTQSIVNAMINDKKVDNPLEKVMTGD